MQYLQIMNDGVCDPESIITLGVSGSRDDNNRIGMFGSGSLHGVLLLLRNNLQPIIYCGDTKITFHTKTTTLKNENQTFEQVYVTIGKTIERLSVSLDFGKIDWDQDINFSTREFVSNALDQANQDPSKISIKIVEEDELVPQDGKTVVGIPLTPEIRKYYNNLDEYFIHFSTNKYTDRILPKTMMGPAKIYRQGVFVKAIESDLPSIFDYNFDSSLKIDESRGLDMYNAQIDVFKLLKASSKIKQVFNALINQTRCWEANFDNYSMNDVKWEDDTKKLWLQVWNDHFCDIVIATQNQGPLIDEAREKGHNIVVIKANEWYNSLKAVGIKTVIDVLINVNDKGHTIIPVSKNTKKTLDHVWNWLEKINLTRNLDKPEIKEFKQVMTSDATTGGYIMLNTVYINSEHSSNQHTMLHELGHYITGSRDGSNNFQEFAFQVAVAFANEMDSVMEKLKQTKFVKMDV